MTVYVCFIGFNFAFLFCQPQRRCVMQHPYTPSAPTHRTVRAILSSVTSCMCGCDRTFYISSVVRRRLHPPSSSVLLTETVASVVAVCFSRLHLPACGPLETGGHVQPCRSVGRIINQSRCHLHATQIITVLTCAQVWLS